MRRALLAAILAIALGAHAAPAQVEPSQLSLDAERALGDAIHARIAASPRDGAGGTLVESAEIDAALLRLAGDGLGFDHEWRIHVLRRPSITSFETVGGHVYVSRGFILACESAGELRAHLRHQITHATLRHALKTMENGYGADAVAALARGEQPHVLDGIAANFTASGTLARHSLRDEMAADAKGTYFGTSPAALLALTSRLNSKSEPAPAWAPDVRLRRLAARQLDVHPVSKERLATLEALGRDRPAPATEDAEAEKLFSQLREVLSPR